MRDVDYWTGISGAGIEGIVIGCIETPGCPYTGSIFIGAGGNS